MFFNENVDTNIDSQFKGKSSNSSNLKDIFDKYKLFIIIGLAVLVIAVILIILLGGKKYEITLYGNKEMILYKDSNYLDPGYIAHDKKGNDVTSSVVVDSNVDMNQLGEYKVTYTLKNTTTYRYVTVVEKPEASTYIHLIGDAVVYLKVGEKYKEPGYVVIDTLDSNLTDKVVTSNNINSNKAGIYRVIYMVTNSSGVTTSISRKVVIK